MSDLHPKNAPRRLSEGQKHEKGVKWNERAEMWRRLTRLKQAKRGVRIRNDPKEGFVFDLTR